MSTQEEDAFTDLSSYDIDHQMIAQLSEAFCREHHVVALGRGAPDRSGRRDPRDLHGRGGP